MPFIAWNDHLSVGVKEIDDDHKKMVGMINHLYDGISSGEGKAALKVILKELVDYSQYHFAHEEQMFAETGYPDAAPHKEAHDSFATRVLAIQHSYNTESPALTLDVMVFLKDWLFEHILGSDKKYGPYLNMRGIY
jgi:hemerythrin